MRAVESLSETVAGQAAKLARVPGIEDTSIQRRRPLKLSMKAFCCGGQERFGTIGPEEAVADFQRVTNLFSSVAQTKLPARLLSRLSPSNFVSNEIQQLMSKSAIPSR